MVCSVDGCDKTVHCRGLCPMHYQRLRIHGSLDKPAPKPRQRKPCSEGGCADPAHARGLCERHYKAAWYAENAADQTAKTAARRDARRAEYLEKSRAYYRANRARILARMSAKYAASPAEKRAASRSWARANAVRRREHEMRRRARMRETQVEPVDYGAILRAHGMSCHICGGDIRSQTDLHFDHVIPLARGGTHTPDNIKPAHARCNIQKGARVA